MLTQKLYDYLLNTNYSYGFDYSMNPNNNSVTSEGKESNIRTKTLNRREPTLSHNVTLLIEFGIVVTVTTVVGLVFYFSHRNFKKRTTVHRRRWLESDIDIDNYSDGQIYDTNASLDECQPHAIDLDQDDFPPPYESVVNQSSTSMKKKRRHSGKRSIDSKNVDGFDRNVPRCHNTNSGRNVQPLMSSQSLNCISTICENSSLIENRQLASTSSPEDETCNGHEEYTMRGKCLKDKNKVDIHRLQKSQLVKIEDGKETNNGKPDIVQIQTLECQNEIALLDASGLPTYDTALKIQECGSM